MSLREKNRLETRQELIGAAVGLIRERGFDQVSVEDICEQAGVSRATFFNYFPQKEMLLTEMAAERLGQMRAFMAAQREWQEPPSVEGLIELFGEFCRQNELIGDLARSLFGRTLAYPACRERLTELRGEAIGLLAAYLTPLVGRGRRKQDPQLVAQTVFAIYMGSMLEWVTATDPAPGYLVERVTARLRVLLTGGRAA